MEQLEEIILLSEFHVNRDKKEQTLQVTELDGKFHEILYQASNSRILKHVLSDFHKYVRLARKASVTNHERAEKSIEEHKKSYKQFEIKMLTKLNYGRTPI